MGKRIAAIIGLVILAAMYIITLISCIMATPESQNLVYGSLAMTVFIPIVLWIFLRLYSRAHANDDTEISMSEMRKYNKRLKKGEKPEDIADEIEKKYNK